MAVNSYETMLIFSVANGEEATQTLVEKFKALVEENGTLESIDAWGERKLAYPINDEPNGYYALYNYTSGPEFPAELERIAKITEGVLRCLVVRK
ncbi:MAG: 30S ribosomal protein S6 [Acutalibacteraceae bacterium]|nr:30S ribosomal protein S6 [Oscillospiraceae bacterium]